MIFPRLRLFTAFLASLVCVSVFSAAAGVLAADTTKYPLTMKDSIGETIVVKSQPKRIVSIAPACTEILYALGLGQEVVGVSSWCDFPAEAKKKEKVGTFSDPNIEKIISLRPDVVLGAAGVSRAALKQLDDLGVPVITCDARTMAGVMELIRMVAKATNAIQAGDAVVAAMQGRIDKVTAKVAKAKTVPKVFYELWNNPTMTAGPGTFINDLIRSSGAVNVAADAKTEWPIYSLEVLIDKNPDVFIYSHGAETVSQIRSRNGWGTMKAMKTGRIVLLSDENVVSRPGPRIVEGLEDFARAIHPELF